MKYFKVVLLKKGKKEEIGFYANDKKEALKVLELLLLLQ